MKTELVSVSPDFAAPLLMRNEVNRNIRPRVVDMYARDMVRGNWLITGESIKISSTGKLLDGQHRLSAVIKSGCTIDMLVVTELDESSQSVMDTPLRRQTGDMLHMRGEVSGTLLVACTRVAIAYENKEATLGSNTVISNSEIYEWIDLNPEIREAVAIATRHGKKLMCPPSLVAFSSWLIWKSVRNWYEIDDFWTAAASKVGLSPGDPVIALTNRFALDRSQRKKIPRPALVSAIVRAWNLRREGKTMSVVRYESASGSGLIPIPEVVV